MERDRPNVRPRRPVGDGLLLRRERIAALVAPAVVVAVGGLVPSSRFARYACDAIIASALAGALALAGAARGRPTAMADDRPVAKPPTQPVVHVLVPAREEATVIADLIGDLGAQDMRNASGAPAFALTVIDDRSRDGTRAAAERAIATAGLTTVARCISRRDGLDGKGAALAVVELDDLDDETIVVVFDADARLTPATLSGLTSVFRDDPSGVTARRRTMLPLDGRRAWFARWQDDEQTVDGAVQRARVQLGGTGEFRGNGMALRAKRLRAIGGWDAAALCEDLEAGTRLAVSTGRGIRWSPDIEVWEQPVLDLRAVIRQRLRWAEGAVRRDLRVTWPAVMSPDLDGRLRIDLAVYAAQTLTPWLAVGLLARGRQRPARRRLLALGVAYFTGGSVLSAAALPQPMRRVPGVLVLSAIWALVLPLAWLRVALSNGPLRFARTVHRPGFSPPTSTRVGAVAEGSSPPRTAQR
jgi:hypothetical protein